MEIVLHLCCLGAVRRGMKRVRTKWQPGVLWPLSWFTDVSRHCVIGGATLAVTCLLVILSCSVGSALTVNDSPAEIIRWAQRKAADDPGLRKLLLEMDDKYDVLFIPGIMGSRLEFDDFTWGESQIQADKLVLDPKRPLKSPPTVLETFDARDRFIGIKWSKQQIYGPGLDELSKYLRKEPLYFAYDWRQDLAETVKEFDNFARTKLKGKKVIVVAHSMGGRMFWHWKNRHPTQDERPFTLLSLVLVGSPVLGSCEVARMLIDGYMPYYGATGFAEFAYDLIFKNAHGAIFTFPSVFQLLPKDDACVALEGSAGPAEQSLLTLDFWKRRFKSHFLEFARSTGMPGNTDAGRLQKYEELVSAALAKARDFRLAFKEDQGDDFVHYIFSSRLKMHDRYILRSDAGSLKIARKETEVFGDGRVPKYSAINRDGRRYPNGQIYRLDFGHGELLSDPKLMDFVDEIKTAFDGRKASEILAYVNKEERTLLRDNFIVAGLVTSPVPFGISQGAVSVEDRNAVASLNLLTLARAGEMPQGFLVKKKPSESQFFQAAYEAPTTQTPEFVMDEISSTSALQVARLLEDNFKNPAAARVIYESIAVLKPDSMDPRTLNRLGYILLKEKKFGAAASTLTEAVAKTKTGGDAFLTEELKGKISRNLSAALFQSGATKGTIAYRPVGKGKIVRLRPDAPERAILLERGP